MLDQESVQHVRIDTQILIGKERSWDFSGSKEIDGTSESGLEGLKT